MKSVFSNYLLATKCPKVRCLHFQPHSVLPVPVQNQKKKITIKIIILIGHAFITWVLGRRRILGHSVFPSDMFQQHDNIRGTCIGCSIGNKLWSSCQNRCIALVASRRVWLRWIDMPSSSVIYYTSWCLRVTKKGIRLIFEFFSGNGPM